MKIQRVELLGNYKDAERINALLADGWWWLETTGVDAFVGWRWFRRKLVVYLEKEIESCE